MCSVSNKKNQISAIYYNHIYFQNRGVFCVAPCGHALRPATKKNKKEKENIVLRTSTLRVQVRHPISLEKQAQFSFDFGLCIVLPPPLRLRWFVPALVALSRSSYLFAGTKTISIPKSNFALHLFFSREIGCAQQIKKGEKKYGLQKNWKTSSR